MGRNSKTKAPATSVEGEEQPPAKRAKSFKKDAGCTAASSSSGPGSPTVAAMRITPVPVSLSADNITAAHKLIDMAKSGSWEQLFTVLDGQKELVNIRPEVREYSVLHQAAYHGCVDIVDKLISKYGADPLQRTKLGQSVLEVAKGQGQLEVVGLLSESSQTGACSSISTPEKLDKPKPSVTPIPMLSSDIISAAHCLIDHAKAGRWQELYDMLDKEQELVNVRPAAREFSSLHQAAYHDNKDALLTLIEKYGADPLQTTGSGLSLMDVAKKQGSETVIEAIATFSIASAMEATKAVPPDEEETEDEFEMKQMPDGSWKVMLKGHSESAGVAAPPKAAIIETASGAGGSASSAAAAPTATVSAKKGLAVDWLFPGAEACCICQHEGTIWDAMLKKASQFYLMQLVEVSADSYCVWSRWGKVDTDGQHETAYFASPELAAAAFKAKFYEKTNNKWEKRKFFKPFFAKYMYTPGSAAADEETPSLAVVVPTPVPPKSIDLLKQAHKLLDLAKAGRWADLLKTLDANKALVNMRPEVREFSALHQAAFQGKDEVVVRLIDEYGADPSQCTKSGKSAAQIADDQGHSKVAEEVRSRLPKTGAAAGC